MGGTTARSSQVRISVFFMANIERESLTILIIIDAKEGKIIPCGEWDKDVLPAQALISYLNPDQYLMQKVWLDPIQVRNLRVDLKKEGGCRLHTQVARNLHHTLALPNHEIIQEPEDS